MFGEREIISVSPCPKHALELQEELQALQDAMFKVLNKTNNNGNKENKEVSQEDGS